MSYRELDEIELLRHVVRWAYTQEEYHFRPYKGHGPTADQIIELYEACMDAGVDTPEALLGTVPWEAPEWLLKGYTGGDLIKFRERYLGSQDVDVKKCGGGCCSPLTRCDICREESEHSTLGEDELLKYDEDASWHLSADGGVVDVCKDHLPRGIKRAEG